MPPMKDLTGKRFSRLTVLSSAGRNKHGKAMWHCRCDCGNEKDIVSSSLVSGHSTSCGCRKLETPYEIGKRNLIDLSGERFGRLVVIEWGINPKNDKPAWRCKCDCGKEAYKKGAHLTRGQTVSCGCYHREEVSKRVKGKGNPMYGLPPEKNPMMRADVKAKVSEKLRGENNPMYGRTGELNPMWGKSGPESPMWGMTGEKSANWRGGISFEPYCPKFNYQFKESIRERFNRTCYLCPTTESDNGRKLSIHHIDYNKNSICNGHSWAFVPLCNYHHNKSNYDRWAWFNLLICYWAAPYMPEGCFDARILVC